MVVVVVGTGASCGAVLGAVDALGAALLGAAEALALALGLSLSLGGTVHGGGEPVCTPGVGSKRTQP